MPIEGQVSPIGALYAAVLSNAFDAVIVCGEDGLIIEFNPAAELVFGRPRVEAVGRAVDEFLSASLPETGKRVEIPALRKCGESFPAEITVDRVEAGGQTLLVSIIRDLSDVKRAAVLTAEIAERRDAEEKLRQSQRMLELVMDNIPQVMFWKDLNSVYLGCNGNFLLNAGLTSADQVIGKNDYDMPWKTEESDFYRLCDRRVMESNRPELGIRETLRTADGTQTTIETNKVPLHDDAGNVIGILGMHEDITGRLEAEVTVRELNLALERRLSHLQCLRQIDLSITGNSGLADTLDLVARLAASELQADAACVLLLHDDTLRYAAGAGFMSNAITRTAIPVGQGNAGRAATGQIVMVNCAGEAARASFFSRAGIIADEGFASYIGVPLASHGKIHGVLDIFQRGNLDPDHDWIGFIETLAGQAAIAVENAALICDLKQSNRELTLAYDRTIEGWSRALDLRDNETEGHTRRVTYLTLRLARCYGIPENELIHIRRGALLHDIGKMGIPDNILLKPGPLTPSEWEIMRLHPVYARDLLQPIDFLAPALDIPFCHHEKWDGTGYPRGLSGEEIPLCARLFAIVDVWDALRSDRPYRQAWSTEKTIEHIKGLSGTHFEPAVVETFMSMIVDEAASIDERLAA